MAVVLHFAESMAVPSPSSGAIAAKAYSDSRTTWRATLRADRLRRPAGAQDTDPAKPAFVHEQDLQARSALRPLLRDDPGELFLKAASATGSIFGWLGRGTTLRQPALANNR